MQIRSVLLTAVLALGISACGSSKESSNASTSGPPAGHPTTSFPSPTPASTLEPAFIARVNAVCARAKSNSEANGPFPYQSFDPLHPDVKLLPKVGAFFAAVQSSGDRVPAELRRLGTPHRAQSEWAKMLVLTQENSVIADRQIKAAEASNSSAFIATVDAVERVDTELQKLGHETGFADSSPCNKYY
jgi:hypothetical protein